MIVSFSSPFSLPFHSLRKSVGSWALLRIPEKGRVFRSHCLLVFTFLVTRAFCQKQNCCTTKCPREPCSEETAEGLQRGGASASAFQRGAKRRPPQEAAAAQRRASKCLARKQRLGKGLQRGGAAQGVQVPSKEAASRQRPPKRRRLQRRASKCLPRRQRLGKGLKEAVSGGRGLRGGSPRQCWSSARSPKGETALQSLC